MWNLKDFLSFRGQVFQRTNMWIFLLFVCSIILWTAISYLYFVPSCFLLDSLWDKIRQLYSLHMAKKAEFGLWMNWGIKEYFQYVILLLIHLSIQTKPSWPYAKSTISLKPSKIKTIQYTDEAMSRAASCGRISVITYFSRVQRQGRNPVAFVQKRVQIFSQILELKMCRQ